MKTRTIYSFGNFRLDASARVLLKEGEPVRLARKAAETLLVLVESAGQVLTKEDLMTALWPDRVVDEANLAQNVAVVRKALGVMRGGPGYIETFPGRGYRILGPVSVSEEPVHVHEEGGHATAEAHPHAEGRPEGAAAESAPLQDRPRRSIVLPVLAVGGVAALALTFWAVRRPSTAPPSGELHRTAVTRFPGREIQPAISADGKQIAFVWEEESGRNGGIWVHTGGSEPPKRISPLNGTYSSPAWSPDGQHLACVRFRGNEGELIVVPAKGGAARPTARVLPPPYGLSDHVLDWSPDGNTLVFADAEKPNGTLSLYSLSFASGERRRLTEPAADLIGDVDPRFSPDGKTITFIRAFHRAWQEVFAVSSAGGQERQLTQLAGQVSGQDWLPAGDRIVFGSDKGGEFRLWTMPASGTADGARPTAIYGDFPLQFSAARKSQALAYAVLHHDFNIWRLDLRAKSGSPSQWTRIVASSAQDVSPQYSPDGTRICFRSDRSGEEQLWVCGSDGSNPVQVTRDKLLRPSVGRWAPDGRAIVFNNARTGDLYVARESTPGNWDTHPLNARGYHPVYSPDGKWIYAGTKGIARLPAQGGAETEITDVRGLSLGASPDGRRLFFVREPSGPVLWSMNLESARVTEVLRNLVPYCTSCWALAPAGIYYLGADAANGGRQALYFHEFATGTNRALVEYPEPLAPIGTGPFSLSPDGRYLLCVRLGPANGDVFRVDPFR